MVEWSNDISGKISLRHAFSILIGCHILVLWSDHRLICEQPLWVIFNTVAPLTYQANSAPPS